MQLQRMFSPIRDDIPTIEEETSFDVDCEHREEKPIAPTPVYPAALGPSTHRSAVHQASRKLRRIKRRLLLASVEQNPVVKFQVMAKNFSPFKIDETKVNLASTDDSDFCLSRARAA